MGHLIVTPEIEANEGRLSNNLHNVGKPLPTSLELISKPLLSGQPVPEDSLLKRLGGNLRDSLFPKKMPPLALASQPIAVVDPMAVKRDPVSSALSFTLHGAVLALIVWLGVLTHKEIVTPKVQQVAIPVYVKPYIPVTAPAPKTMGGGGGGGAHKEVPVTKGRTPEIAKAPVAPVPMLKVDHPKLAVVTTPAKPQPVKMPMNNAMPVFGMTQAPKVALVSQGGGSGVSFGQGHGGGFGSSVGTGAGPGSGGGYGGGVMTVGGGVSAPQVLHSVEPQFTDAARNAKYQGTVSIQLIVDAQGNPQNIHVIRHLGMGLDQKAIQAVRQYKFKPAMYQGHPVPVQMVIDISFHLD